MSESYVVSVLGCNGDAKYYPFSDKNEAVEEYVRKMRAGIEMAPAPFFIAAEDSTDVVHINEVFMEVFRAGQNKVWFSSGEFLCEHEEVPGSTK